MYSIYARIEDEEYLLESDIPEEELEGSLQNLTRKQEFKNVTRFEIREETDGTLYLHTGN
jgi:hypothetical protein